MIVCMFCIYVVSEKEKSHGPTLNECGMETSTGIILVVDGIHKNQTLHKSVRYFKQVTVI